MTKRLLLLLVAIVSLCTMWADEPFRLHRYSSFQATPVTESTIVFAGNSITNMQVWAEYFDTDLPVVNRGNSGGYSYELLREVQSFITGRPKQIFIMIGTNDLGTAGHTPQTVEANVRQMVKHIVKESPSTKIFIESIMPSTSGSRTLANIKACNALLKALAEETANATYVDYYDALLGLVDGTHSTAYDALHPHVVGSSIWTRAVLEYVSGASQAILPASPEIYNGGAASSFGARLSCMAQLPVTSNDILFIGDEIVHSGEWQELLRNPNVKNRGTGWGFPGPSISYVTTSIQPILKGLASNAEPKQILLNTGYSPLNAASPDLTTIKNDYQACIDKIREHAPTARLSLVAIAPNGTSSYNANIKTFNAWLKSIAADNGYDYIDIYSVLATSADAVNTTYMQGSYPYGLGYQAMAREIAKYVDGCNPMTEEEATNYFKLIAARKTLSNAIDAIEMGRMTEGTSIGTYPAATAAALTAKLDDAYAMLANNDATSSELSAAGTALSAAVEAAKADIIVPSESTYNEAQWYLISTARFPSNYFVIDATNGLVSSTDISPYGYSYWKLVKRTDGTFDIVNHAGSYIGQSANNTQLPLSATQPTAGWSFVACDAFGAFNVTSTYNGSVDVAMNQTQSHLNYKIYNWNTGIAADAGSQLYLTAVEVNEEDLQEDESQNVPFHCTALDESGNFAGAQWWYNIKVKNTHYLYDNGTETYMSLNRATLEGDDSEQWAIVGTDQKGYTIYNRKYGTAKVLATSVPTSNNADYPILVDASNVPSGYSTKWQFEASTSITNVDGVYMSVFGSPSAAVNNFGANGKLTFWLNGKDSGSTLSFELAEAEIPINSLTGSFTASANFVSSWASTITDPFSLTFSTTNNNIAGNSLSETGLTIWPGSASGPWSISVSNQDYYVAGYSFEALGGKANHTITPNGDSAISLNTSNYTNVSVELSETDRASFTFAGDNTAGTTLRNFTVNVKAVTIEPEPQYNIFLYGSDSSHNICYRIPAIGTASNGTVIAVADYRYGGADIGFGRVSLHYALSKDNGTTWSDPKVLVESHQGSYGVDKANDLEAGFGDPAIVCDRESGKVMVLSCCGNVSYPAGTWNHHQGIARFYSEDNGETFGTYTDISPDIYQQFKDLGVDVQAMFVGSGKIVQSRYVKVADYYRLYCVVLLRTSSTGGLNYVIYSDDFGQNWKLLGSDNLQAGVTGGDEPKCEELPDGSLLLSSRAYGRIFNIFKFSDLAKAQGEWLTQATSNSPTDGTYAQGNACNGEIMIIPVKRNADNKKMFLALQSVPFGPGGRYNVGIHIKALEQYADYSTPAAVAAGWNIHHQSSRMSSAYSTMIMQQDNTIGFLYEESTYGKDYTIVYKNYTVEYLTDTLYTYDDSGIEANPFVEIAETIDSKTDGLCTGFVGGVSTNALPGIQAVIAAFKATPNMANYQAIDKAIADAERVAFKPNVQYILRNTTRGNDGQYALKVNSLDKYLTVGAYSATDASQQWTLVPYDDTTYYVYNEATESFIGSTPEKETKMYTTDDVKSSALYSMHYATADHIALVCTTPTNTSYPALHLAGDNTRIVCWTAGAAASQWYFEPTEVPAATPDVPTGIQSLQADAAQANANIYDLQGRAILAPNKGLYIVKGKKIVVK